MFVLRGEGFRIVPGTEGQTVLAVAWHPRDHYLLATPTRLMEVVGRQAYRIHRSRLTCMTLDRWGDVWLGTEAGGLIRHTSAGFREYREGRHLPDSRIRGVAEDAEGNLYVGTGKGVAVLERPRWLIISQEWPVRCVERSCEGRVWVGFDRGAACFKGLHRVERLDETDLPASPEALADSPEGGSWIALGKRGLWRLDAAGEITRFPLQGEAPDEPAPAAVTRLYMDHDGTLWAGLPGVGVARIRGPIITFFGPDEGLQSLDLLALGRWPNPP